MSYVPYSILIVQQETSFMIILCSRAVCPKAVIETKIQGSFPKISDLADRISQYLNI